MSDDFTLTELLNEQEWRKCFPDWDSTDALEKAEAFKHFCREHWRILHPSKKRVPFELSDAQEDALECILTERYSLFLKARQVGFSTLVASYCFWATWGYPDRRIIMLSIGQREAIKLLRVAKYGYRSLPLWIKHHGPTCAMTQEKMVFSNESSIESLPSGEDPARGETVWTAVLDEWASLKNPDAAWASVEPVADVGGSIIALSTAKGEGNIFHTQWVGSKGGGNGTNRFRGMFFPWWTCAALDRDQKWYDLKAADTADHVMAQEYPDDPDDAFLRSGRPVFNLTKIKEWEPTFPIAEGRLVFDDKGKIVFEEGGFVKIWEWPVPRRKYVVGADVAEGLEHGDYSSAHVLDAKTRLMVAHYHGHIDVDLFGEDLLNKLGRFYNKALMGVERNAMGLAPLKALQRVGYQPIFRQRSQQLRTPSPTESLGWHTLPTTKGMAIAELGAEFRNGIAIPDADTIQELKTYRIEGNGKMMGSPHDDRVMSLAIAVQMLKYVHLREYTVKEEPGPGTAGYFDRMVERAMSKQRRGGNIGAHSFRNVA